MIDNSIQTRKTSPTHAEDSHWHPGEDGLLLDRLRRSLSLPALPPIASQILKMCRDEDADIEKLANLMSQDPAVVARLLQIANSSYYGGARHTVGNIAQAITLLGMNAVSSLALSFCFYRLCQDMNQAEHVGMDHTKFWRRSIIASIAGRTLGHWCKLPDPEFVFISALLQDIGLLAFNEVAPEVTRTLIMDAKDNHTQLQQFEKQYYGCDHATVGRWVAELWQLPKEFQVAISASHQPDAGQQGTEEQKTAIRCVALSGLLADLWCHPTETEEAVRVAASAAQEWLELSTDDVLAIIDQIPQGLSEIASFFQVHIGSTAEVEQPLHVAATILSSHLTRTTQAEHA
ncbi:MAG: HD family phosphohydrolase [Nitrospirales bacterium]|nr:MAG: HD family phosphohydrolase [Nitrospirales bacterium]